ncbi:MAG TPA: alpha/beta fold hydrolase [Ramlibacter sp.]|uniref:esterase/lipase family protein n=1 Tax=Ramlibacter sp. TaxID=1917967 RepID=UPI002C15D0C5|nr:alpha/beta fold hydrolase [Ramlibacter sp.]HVZ44099.1 alpha/beta fold hydrolase [Ramlibacter sp.]
MPPTSRLARLQQALVAALAAAALAWFVTHWRASPVNAVAGVLVIAFAHAWVLAWEGILVWFVSRGDTAPRPSPAELAAAWWAEVWCAPRVFYWRQPFRWRAVPDDLGSHTRGKRGIVFIHGFVCNRGLWTPWLERVRKRGHAYVAVNLEPVFGSIDDYAEIIESAVRDVASATGMPPVLVCHSMGGLAARAWLRKAADASRAHRVITIASPHAGTWLARFSHVINGSQMRRGGSWLLQLAADEAGRPRPPFTCWYTHCDNIVLPASTATLAGADNRLVLGAAHVDLAFHPRVMDETLLLALGM